MLSGTVSSVPVLPHEVGTTTGTSIGCCGRTGWRLTQLNASLPVRRGSPCWSTLIARKDRDCFGRHRQSWFDSPPLERKVRSPDTEANC